MTSQALGEGHTKILLPRLDLGGSQPPNTLPFSFMASSQPALTGVRVVELAGLSQGIYQPSSTT